MRELHHSPLAQHFGARRGAQRADAGIAPALRRKLGEHGGDFFRMHREEQLVVVAAGERESARLLLPTARTSGSDTGTAAKEISTPVWLALASLPASPRSPSETSMQALAWPRSRSPSAMRGVGRRNRSRRYASARGSAASRRSSSASPAAASPGVPETNSASPARPPQRLRAAPGGTVPRSCTVTVRGPRVVSP